MDRLERIYKLHGLLRDARHPIARRSIEEALGCGRITFQRIVDEMRTHLDAPIEYDRDRNGWYYDQRGEHPFELPGLWFNAHELHALLVINKLLQDMEPGLLEAELSPIQKRIEKLLASKQLGSGELVKRIKLLTMGKRKEMGAFQTVADATLQRQRLEVRYHARQDDAVTRRILSPQRLVHYRDNWYLDAHCHLRDELRSFSVDRIRQPVVLDEPAVEIDEQVLKEHFAEAYGIFAGRADQHAILRFTPKAARWISEESWHPQQQGRFLDSGHYELTLPYGQPQELIMDIMRHGPEVEVIAPAALRQAVAERLREALEHYGEK